MADGSISIRVDAETKQAQRELAKLERSMQKTADAMEKTGTQKNGIAEQLDVARKKAEETRDAIAAINEERDRNQRRMNAAGPGKFTSDDWSAYRSRQEALLQQRTGLEKELVGQEKEVNKLTSLHDALSQKLQTQTAEYEKQKAAVGEMRARLMQTGGQAMERIKAGAASVTQSFNKTLKSILKWGLGIRSVFILFRKIRSGIMEGFRDYISRDPETKANIDALKASLNGLKLAWGAAFAPIVNLVAPLLQKLIEWLTAAANALNQFFSALSGKSTYKKAVANMNSVASSAGAAGAAAEEAKKQVMGFDEINRLDDNRSSGGGGGGGGGTGLGDLEEETINPKLLTALEWVKDHLREIELLAGTIGAALLAWKLSNKLGVGFDKILGSIMIIYGAVLMVKNAIDAWKNGIDYDNLSKMLGGIAVAATGAAIAFGSVGAAIALLVGGITLLVIAFHEWITTGELTSETLTALVIGIGLVAAAIALLTSNAYLGLLIAGIGLLIVGLIDWIKTGELSQRTFQILANGILLVGAAIALLTGSWLPLLIAGIVLLVLAIVKNWDQIKETTIKIWNTVKDTIVKTWEKIKSKTIEIWTAIITWVTKKWERITEKAKEVWDSIKDAVVKTWENTKAKAIEIWDAIKDWISDTWDELTSTATEKWEGIKSSIVGVWEDLKGDLKDVWDDILDWFHGVWDGLKEWWEGLTLNPFHIPHPEFAWTYTEAEGLLAKAMKFAGLEPRIPHLSISWMAKGGILDGATLIGAGEKGKEAIIPLERNTEWIRNIANELFGMMEDHFDNLLPGLPAMAMGSVVPPRSVSGSAMGFSDADISRLVSGIQSALNANNSAIQVENKVYLDGKQITDAVTKWQRRNERGSGV